MPIGEYAVTSGYVPQVEAARRLRVARGTEQRMARDGRLPAYSDPRDKRVCLARVEDVERLARPVPAE